MIVYFSGTGNSRFAADLVHEVIGGECINSFEYIKNGKHVDFQSETPFVFVSPTYSWRLPKIFSEFIKNSRFNGNKKAYFIMTCGGEIGDSEKYIKKLCNECGFDYMGVFQVVMPENYIALFYVPDKNEAYEIIKKSVPQIVSAANRIKNNQLFVVHPPTFADKLKSGLVNDLFYKFIVSAKKFKVGSNCIFCGKCVSVCPSNNIKLKNSVPVWGDKCVHCMACISLCPVRAIEYGNASKKRNIFFNSYKPSDIK